MSFLFEPAPVTALPVEGGGEFPVSRIFCVGQNYAEHIREMGGTDTSIEPVLFMKPSSAISTGPDVPYPPVTTDLHHEVELVAAIGPEGVIASGVGIDLTRRDLQGMAKKRGGPWEIGKAFDNGAVMGLLTPGQPPAAGAIRLSVNGEIRQDGDLSQMNRSLPELLALIGKYFTLRAGDLVFTGTPSGVGPLLPGDRVEAEIAGLPPLSFKMTDRKV
ncbi:fumarylacetoacetate hydrolase family protein [Hyphobacterium sp. HN65]|uniref:Fumarylacetoacetate hydrolase family protein n=1 Tax=Hyphobacterium lacteum TaxID=3116575 RepID=A0ABU7LQS2_9PROT|nr:fumarylacetoacetate hydrolase family protein [Hyphobacterium sp. HN65]MEE2526248.1 fumarylacetoacetate hydrolase family protein [Hyphobacterium sp. HN65]